MSRPSWIEADLHDLEWKKLRRSRQFAERNCPGCIQIDGREYIDVASNDYLGLAADPRLRNEVREHLDESAWGAAASPLITGYHPWQAQLESAIASFMGSEAALVFNSGYVGNLATLSALLEPTDIVFCEKRSHASLIDGCRLSRAKLRVFRSRELETLRAHLARSIGHRRRVIVTDSVFSMDGDIAPLDDLCSLADEFEAILYVDEAHAVGVFGANGRGVAELLGVEAKIPLRFGTLGKAFGCVGGFIAADREWIEWLTNRARGYIYSTAMPPILATAAVRAIDIVRSEPDRRGRVLAQSATLRQRLLPRFDSVRNSQSPILPIVVGEPEAAISLANQLRDDGFWSIAIRPPTVPAGASRLRVSLSSSHRDEDLSRLADRILVHAAN